jgi:rare lipoprotein A
MNASTRLLLLRILALALPLLLAACGSQPSRAPEAGAAGAAAVSPAPTFPAGKKPPVVTKRGGGFYKDDGPGDNPPADVDAIADAVPRAEPPNRFANQPYSVFGQDYVPLPASAPYSATGVASWYGRKFHGQKTSSGEPYDMYGMTAAHPTLPIPSYVRVTNPRNGKSVVVRVNDRGPFLAGRLIDLSWAAAYKLDYLAEGSTLVRVERVFPGQTSPAEPFDPMADDPIARLAMADQTGEAAPSTAAALAPPPRLPEVTRAGGHYLQLGAFANRDNAEALRGHLARELGELGDKLVIAEAGKVFRVQLGPWPDDTAARQAGEQLRTSLGLGAIVVRR